VATHRRCWKKERTIFDPGHYFALLERKPGALDYALPLASFTPPANFGVLRRRLEAEFGDRGTREYVKVLRLLEHATPAELEHAVARALELGTPVNLTRFRGQVDYARTTGFAQRSSYSIGLM
jgi:hypothetical protein